MASSHTTELIDAVLSGSVEAVRDVLALGEAELEARDECGATAYLNACRKGHTEIMAALVRAGCDRAATTNKSSTALMLTACSGSAEAVQDALALREAELEARNDEGLTAFLGACCNGHTECMAVLARAGCDTMTKDNDGDTAMRLVAKHQNSNELKELLRTLQREQKVKVLTQRAEELVASEKFDEAAAALKTALSLAPDHTRLLALQRRAQQGAAEAFERAEQQARQAEAELMAMLGGDDSEAKKTTKKKKAKKKKTKKKSKSKDKYTPPAESKARMPAPAAAAVAVCASMPAASVAAAASRRRRSS